MRYPIKSLNGFLNHWGDAPSIQKVAKSDKSKDWHKVEMENILKDMAMRFQHSPNPNNLSLWAKDLSDLGYTAEQVKEVCRSAPYKFERHPTLSQLNELLRPYLAINSVSRSEIDEYTHMNYFDIRAKFVSISDEATLSKMTDVYVKKVFPGLVMFNRYYQELCMLNDWCRSYFQKGEAIIDQGMKSNEAAEKGDIDYFVRKLKAYDASKKDKE